MISSSFYSFNCRGLSLPWLSLCLGFLLFLFVWLAGWFVFEAFVNGFIVLIYFSAHPL
jgi:hypothetical protein